MCLAFLFRYLLEGSPMPGTSKKSPVSSLNNFPSAQTRQRAGGSGARRKGLPSAGGVCLAAGIRKLMPTLSVLLSFQLSGGFGEQGGWGMCPAPRLLGTQVPVNPSSGGNPWGSSCGMRIPVGCGRSRAVQHPCMAGGPESPSPP